MADGGNDRHRACAHRPAQLLVAEGEQLGGVTTAAGKKDDIHLVVGGQPCEGVHDGHGGRGTRQVCLQNPQRVPRETGRHHRLDVLADRGVGAAHHPDPAGQPRNGPPGPVQQAVGVQPPAGLGDHGGDGAVTDRCHRFRDQLEIAPLADPGEGADDADPLPRHRPATGGSALGAGHGHLGRSVTQGEVDPATACARRSVDLALDRDPAHRRQRPGDLARQADQRDGPRRAGPGRAHRQRHGRARLPPGWVAGGTSANGGPARRPEPRLASRLAIIYDRKTTRDTVNITGGRQNAPEPPAGAVPATMMPAKPAGPTPRRVCRPPGPLPTPAAG